MQFLPQIPLPLCIFSQLHVFCHSRSKKVRCCKPCFDSHSEGGADQLSASMVANESDDDEEDEEEDGAEGKDGEEASGADINHEVSDAASSSSSSKPGERGEGEGDI